MFIVVSTNHSLASVPAGGQVSTLARQLYLYAPAFVASNLSFDSDAGPRRTVASPTVGSDSSQASKSSCRYLTSGPIFRHSPANSVTKTGLIDAINRDPLHLVP